MKELGTSDTPLAVTEQANPLSEDIDAKSSVEIVEILNREDAGVARVVYEARATIAAAIDWVARALSDGGRLIYVGAGTSGRLGQLDAAECPPTFGVDEGRIVAVIAGGPKALTRSVEGAEDSAADGARDLARRKPTRRDVVLGISAGAAAAYVRGALDRARQAGAKTIFLTSTPLQERADFVDLVISVITGPEAITGSTRMKAGTATKMVLNIISTGAMIRTGRTYGNLMVDLSCSNRKLVRRGVRIIQNVTEMPEAAAAKLLKESGNQVKTALAMGVLGVTRRNAEKLVKGSHGFLRRLFKHPHQKNPAIDAVIFDMDGTILHYALPTGFSTWAALGWAFNIFGEMEEWVDQYLEKKISYDDIWKRCAERIRDQPFSQVRDVLFPCAGIPPYSRGFTDCVAALRGHYRLGIVSSGISLVSEEVRRTMSLDFEVSNHLGVSGGHFDGSYAVRVPFDRKIEALRAKANELAIPLDRICFVGDSPNDMETLRNVGLGVAYRPKTEEVISAAGGRVIGDFLQLPRVIEECLLRPKDGRRPPRGRLPSGL